MLFPLILLSVFFLDLASKEIYITFNREACKWDQSDCDGTREKPYSNPILAFKFALYRESLEKSGILQFYLEAGGHTILHIDFSGDSSPFHRKSIFVGHEG